MQDMILKITKIYYILWKFGIYSHKLPLENIFVICGWFICIAELMVT